MRTLWGGQSYSSTCGRCCSMASTGSAGVVSMVLPYLSAAEGLSRFLVDFLDSLGMFKGNEAERNEGAKCQLVRALAKAPEQQRTVRTWMNNDEVPGHAAYMDLNGIPHEAQGVVLSIAFTKFIDWCRLNIEQSYGLRAPYLDGAYCLTQCTVAKKITM